jgi:phage repressor protein C with HTH and peptisase S24 domain
MPSTRGERLRAARATHFKSARLAAKAMGIPVSTYGAHERAEADGGRDFGPDEARKYGRRFKVSPEWLLTGRLMPGEKAPTGVMIDPSEMTGPKVKIKGYVGAGAQAHYYALGDPDLDEVDAPEGSNEATVAVEIRGDSLGPFFDRWLVFYDDVRRPVTSDLIGRLCVVGLEDGRILIKKLQGSREPGLFTLHSQTEPPIADVALEWAARVKTMMPH